jgi:hypothetical protein
MKFRPYGRGRLRDPYNAVTVGRLNSLFARYSDLSDSCKKDGAKLAARKMTSRSGIIASPATDIMFAPPNSRKKGDG